METGENSNKEGNALNKFPHVGGFTVFFLMEKVVSDSTYRIIQH